MMTGGAGDPAGFRRLMGRWPTGVAVITARESGRDHGMTVNALLSVSLDPPTVLVSLGQEADTTPVVERVGRFAASFLASGQRALSERFARSVAPEEKFAGLALARSPGGVALLPGSVAHLECRVTGVHPGGDHRLVLGVAEWTALFDGPPLLFQGGRYAEADGASGYRWPEVPHG